MKNDEFENIAILIDAENISHQYLKKLFEIVAAFGQISVRRIYADWTDNKRNPWKPLIHEFALNPIQQFSNKDFNGNNVKNVGDFALVIDAMDLLHEGIFDCFCIVSSDSDFTKLAQRIREKGKFVVGLGEKKAVRSFVNSCNIFKYLDDDSEKSRDKTSKPKTVVEESETTLDSLMQKAVENLADTDGWAKMNKIIPYLKQIKPDFTLESYSTEYKKIRRLADYFKNNKDYELEDENTIVRYIISLPPHI
ncbi:MAG: NYN domain-containing protein [Spirochaetaceae bacterium]|jgi:uncharacterized LabA/DUF88 family protein|nr:NYN domain-containing protein [Spirochaetaceae bacterium]